MKKLILATAMAAVAVPLVASPADAQGRNERRELRECREELRESDSRREYRQERRECARELRQARNRDSAPTAATIITARARPAIIMPTIITATAAIIACAG